MNLSEADIENAKHARLSDLAIAAPEAVEFVLGDLFHRLHDISYHDLVIMADEIQWAASREKSFGLAVASGFTHLLGHVADDMILAYQVQIRKAGIRGPALGRLLAENLVPVIQIGGETSLDLFLNTMDILMQKGAYALYAPIEALAFLFKNHETDSAHAFMDLLNTVFSQDLTYNRCRHLNHILSVAAKSMSPEKRICQIQAMTRVARASLGLIDGFLEGLDKGLNRLNEPALTTFVSAGLDRFKQSQSSGQRFLSLASRSSQEELDRLQVAVSLIQIQSQLSRYIRARTGHALSIKPLSVLSDIHFANAPRPDVCFDGQTIYLPDEISRFETKHQNIELYKCLTRLEVGVHEFGSDAFDLEKTLDRIPGLSDRSMEMDPAIPDLDRFLNRFSNPELAADLFTILDQGRIRLLCESRYPGLVKKLTPMMVQEMDRFPVLHQPGQDLLKGLYCRFALGIKPNIFLSAFHQTRITELAVCFEKEIEKDLTVETVGVFLETVYPRIETMLQHNQINHASYQRFNFPWGRRLFPNLVHQCRYHQERLAEQIQSILADHQIRVYRSTILNQISEKGQPDSESILSIIHSAYQSPDNPIARIQIDRIVQQLSDMMHPSSESMQVAEENRTAWYREWDFNLADYLQNHVRVVNRDMNGGNADFYRQTRGRHSGRVHHIRRAFEMLQPQGVGRLRPWREGEELDYPALMDFITDRKLGQPPSDCLYIKRIKNQRSVSVLLLVDLSRSTANPAAGSGMNSTASVLDVEKEAIVLFCEALDAVGDAFAIAGFSGTGRLSVDYYRIKEFEDILNDRVYCRIGAMSSQRSTRMGAAIRHATRQLNQTLTAVKLMIILGDGFPNDVDYKQGYAIADTHKSILEAFSSHIHVHAITVNMVGDPRLDELYGATHHHVISDVTELPDKLIRVYRALTRQ
jgi:hypothetical protein